MFTNLMAIFSRAIWNADRIAAGGRVNGREAGRALCAAGLAVVVDAKSLPKFAGLKAAGGTVTTPLQIAREPCGLRGAVGPSWAVFGVTCCRYVNTVWKTKQKNQFN